MKIATLEFIHSMLLEEARTREGMKKYAADTMHKAREQYSEKQISKAKYEEVLKNYEKHYGLYRTAKDALDDFEEQDF